MRIAVVALLLAGCASLPVMEPRTSVIRTLEADACTPLSWPVDATLSSTFGPRDGRPHNGIDLAAPEGTEVHAACAGVVRYAGDEQRGYGRLVIVEHAGGLLTYYAHNSAFAVRAGELVARGGLVAYSGATGHVTAPHVHFEVRRGSVAVDPLPLLGPRSDDHGMGYALGPAVSIGPRTP